jgi:PTS system nitrogen regulatory IIA component
MASPEDFDLPLLAEYLHVSLAHASKLAERGRVPGRRVSGQWRFSRTEINSWIESRLGDANPDEMAPVRQVVLSPEFDSATPTLLAELLPLDAIAAPLAARTRQSVIDAMVELAAATGMLWDPARMKEAVKTREELHSTALENGVALLHPRRPLPAILEAPFLALGVTSSGIPFGDARGRMTDIFFLICSISDRGHLRTLARLSKLLSDPQALDEIRSAENARDLRESFVASELRIFGET